MYLVRFEPMLLSCFCVFRILATFVDISGISHMSAIQALGVCGSIGTKYIKLHLDLHFLFTALCLYSRYIYLI